MNNFKSNYLFNKAQFERKERQSWIETMGNHGTHQEPTTFSSQSNYQVFFSILRRLIAFRVSLK